MRTMFLVLASFLTLALSGCSSGRTNLAGLPGISNAAAVPDAGQTYQTIFAFNGTDGEDPVSGVTIDGGDVYGTASHGGPSRCDCGLVYKLTPKGSAFDENVLYAFTGNKDGSTPLAGVTLDDNQVFGVAWNGGKSFAGTFYSLTPKGAGKYYFNAIYSFGNTSTDGGHPNGAPLLLDGNFYGADTSDAGGVVYKFGGKKPYAESMVTDLTAVQGPDPDGVLVGSAGKELFGVSQIGGQSKKCKGSGGCGTVFEVDAAGKHVQVLHSFAGTDGDIPIGGLWRDAKGDLFGVTEFGGSNKCFQGCGIVFELARNGNKYTMHVVHQFTGGGDGRYPQGTVVGDAGGNLYGTTSGQGRTCDCGTVFRLVPTKTGYSKGILHTFSGGSDGKRPAGPLTIDSGNLYGTTTEGGGSGCNASGCGTVYRIQL